MNFQILDTTPEQRPGQGAAGLRPRIGGFQLPRCRLGLLAVCLAAIAPPAAHAVDGCTVLLCLAAPSWRSIEPCVPPIRQLLRDLARGRAFPTCTMSGAGNSASHAWSSAPDFCPRQYTRYRDGPNGTVYSCEYDGAITVTLNGAVFSQTWWSGAGDSVTDFSAQAKAQLGSWDTRFDDDLADWLARGPVIPALPGAPIP